MNEILNKTIIFEDLGLIKYEQAWNYQKKLHSSTIDIKVANREKELNNKQLTPNYLLFCSHPNVYTLGKSGSINHLLINNIELENKNIEFFKINRGGDITYHGPGQVVGYPIIDLDNFFTDIHRYMRSLEEVIIKTLFDYGIIGMRLPGATGVWLDADKPQFARKICAFGVHCSRWVSMHGWAFNVNTDLSYFNYIVPCGIIDKTVTSLNKELNVNEVNINEVKTKLQYYFAQIFNAEILFN